MIKKALIQKYKQYLGYEILAIKMINEELALLSNKDQKLFKKTYFYQMHCLDIEWIRFKREIIKSIIRFI